MINITAEQAEFSNSPRSDARAYEFGHFVGKDPGIGVLLDPDYNFVKIHESEELLPVFIENNVERGKITFRVSKDIEFLGVELQGYEIDEIPSDWNDLTFSGRFKITMTETGDLIDRSKCGMTKQKSKAQPNKRVAMPIPLSFGLYADKWYTLEFKIKGPQLRFGTNVKANQTVIDLPYGAARFEFKDGVNTGKLAGILFRAIELLGPHDRCQYAASRYDSVGYRKLEREDNGVVTFKVSRPIDLTGIRFFGLRPENYEPDGTLASATHSAFFEIYDVTNNDKIVHATNARVFESISRSSQFGFPTLGHGPFRLKADTIYSLKFQIRGPKLRYGLNPRNTVTVRDDCICDYRTVSERPPVTFTFLEETRSVQLEAIVFAFVNDDEEKTKKNKKKKKAENLPKEKPVVCLNS